MVYNIIMIIKLVGMVDSVEPRYLIIINSGIGYRVWTLNEVLEKVRSGEEISLWIAQIIREDSQELYGFLTREMLDLFELLITISGIGPKSALAVLNTASIETIREAVANNDISLLTKVSGIGKKIAQKIILELKDKLGEVSEGGVVTSSNGVLAIDALVALGYSEREAREVVKKVAKQHQETQDLVKAALKELGRQ